MPKFVLLGEGGEQAVNTDSRAAWVGDCYLQDISLISENDGAGNLKGGPVASLK